MDAGSGDRSSGSAAHVLNSDCEARPRATHVRAIREAEKQAVGAAAVAAFTATRGDVYLVLHVVEHFRVSRPYHRAVLGGHVVCAAGFLLQLLQCAEMVMMSCPLHPGCVCLLLFFYLSLSFYWEYI